MNAHSFHSAVFCPAALLVSVTLGTGAVTYVDGDSLDLALYSDGSSYTPPSAGSGFFDDHDWLRRTGFANGGSVMTSNEGAPQEDAPILQVTISGLTPNATYAVFGYFWDNGENWRLKGTVDTTTVTIGTWPSSDGINQNVLDDGTAGDLTDDFIDNDIAVAFSADGSGTSTAGTNLAFLDTTADGLADSYFSTGNVMVTEGNRTMYEAAFGQSTANDSGELTLLIDDLRNQSSTTNRTWFDGVGVEVIPEPAISSLLGLALLGLIRRRR